MTHAELNQVALRWLRRPERNRGPGCLMALSEVSADSAGERADAWGYRFGSECASVVVEVKVSRADFLRDKKKRHRQTGGFGDYRYFMCPEGMITLDDLPERWGLLWVSGAGQVKVLGGHVCVQISEVDGEGRGLTSLWRHDCCVRSERQMLSLLLQRNPRLFREYC